MSIIFVSHDLNVISKISDKVQVMYAGEIVEYGEKSQLIQQRKHPYTNGLLNSLPGSQIKNHKLYSIPGIVPDLKNRPKGCQFAPRCEYAELSCEDNGTIPLSNDDRHYWKCIKPLKES